MQSAIGVVGTAVKEAIRLGYKHIDCAHCYNNESEVGEALAEVVGDGPDKLIRREDLFVTSKLCERTDATLTRSAPFPSSACPR